MTIPRHITPILALVAVGALLQGCGRQSAGSGERLFASDFQGASKVCTVSRVAPAAGKIVDATMTVGVDGGWCGLPVNNGGRPFDTELLTARPAHGKVYVHSVGTETRIDYTPSPNFTGADTFTVQLLPGDDSVRVTVTAK
jgi:Bacterial Ig domain